MCHAIFAQLTIGSLGCGDIDLDEFETEAMTLLYEFTHLNPAYFSLTTSPNPLFDDYVYGSANCASLAVGRSTASQAIKNTDNWVFVTLDAYCSDKSKKQIELDFSDSRLYASIDGQSPGCLLGDQNQWIISARGSCSASGVASNPKASGGPGGCGIPDISGLNGVNVADCWQFPQGTTAVEITLAVTNATKGFYTDYNVTAFTKPDCSGTTQS